MTYSRSECYIPWNAKWRLLFQGVHLAVAHVDWKFWWAIGRHFSRNKIDNIMAVRELKNAGAIKHHSGSPITIGNLIWQIR